MTEPRPTVFDDILDLALARDETRRATLVRVLVDGFIRDSEPRNARERRQFEELMVNLLGSVDAFTRAVVAQKLAPRSDVPERLVDLLLADNEDIAESFLARSPLAHRVRGAAETSGLVASARRNDATQRVERLDQNETHGAPASDVAPARAPVPTFLDASSDVRRALIDHLADSDTGGRCAPVAAHITTTLLRHAVLRQRSALASTLGNALGISAGSAQRIIDDPGGEPLVVAARALPLPDEAFTQLLLLANPAIGESYDKVKSLQTLYARTRVGVARAIIASLAVEDHSNVRHQPVLTRRRGETASPVGARPPRRAARDDEPSSATGTR